MGHHLDNNKLVLTPLFWGLFCLVSLTKYSGILLAQLSNIKQIQILEGSEKEFLFRCPHTSGQFVAPEMMEMDSGKIQFSPLA